MAVLKNIFANDLQEEGIWRRIPEIEHIKVCHTIHHMFDHQDLPIVDILHICNFRTEIVHKVSHDVFGLDKYRRTREKLERLFDERIDDICGVERGEISYSVWDFATVTVVENKSNHERNC